jgi:hypothetical protein
MSNADYDPAYNTAVTIMNDRVDGAGFTGASVMPQGGDLIVVTVPGKDYCSAPEILRVLCRSCCLRMSGLSWCAGQRGPERWRADRAPQGRALLEVMADRRRRGAAIRRSITPAPMTVRWR